MVENFHNHQNHKLYLFPLKKKKKQQSMPLKQVKINP